MAASVEDMRDCDEGFLVGDGGMLEGPGKYWAGERAYTRQRRGRLRQWDCRCRISTVERK